MPDIRADFSRGALVRPPDFEWRPSPGGEVERMMLDRVGDEVAIATSLVRYPPGSRFPAHEHPMGEEYLVLEGEFGDEHGRQPAGTYVRNPPGSGHAPFSDPGCVIWVKLRQFHPEDRRHVVARIDDAALPDGIAQRELHCFADEVVKVITAPAGSAVAIPAGELVQEVLVVAGTARLNDLELPRWSWLRLAAGEGAELAAAAPLTLLCKTRPEFALP